MELECVLESSDPVLLEVAKSVLQEAGIDYIVSGEAEFGVLPVLPPRIEVARERAEEAKELLAGLAEGAGIADIEPDDESEEE